MTRFGWLVASGIAIAAIGIALLLWGFARQSSPDLTPGKETTDVDPATLAIYTNGVYGFSVLYPADAQVEDAFDEERTFSWRANAGVAGTPILRIRTARGEVRVGASGESRARTSCTIAGPSETAIEPLTVGTTTWSVFTFDALGTDDERRVTSYRTIHEEQCFAIETFESLAAQGSGAPVDDVSFVVRNFTFAR